jgi:hypothetical protein
VRFEDWERAADEGFVEESVGACGVGADRACVVAPEGGLLPQKGDFPAAPEGGLTRIRRAREAGLWLGSGDSELATYTIGCMPDTGLSLKQ